MRFLYAIIALIPTCYLSAATYQRCDVEAIVYDQGTSDEAILTCYQDLSNTPTTKWKQCDYSEAFQSRDISFFVEAIEHSCPDIDKWIAEVNYLEEEISNTCGH